VREASLAEERIKVAEVAVNAAPGRRAQRARVAGTANARRIRRQVASERAERLDRELAAARARLGVQVPADEVVFIRRSRSASTR